jgi:hypothetical protein
VEVAAPEQRRILVAVAAPEEQRILAAGSRIQVQEHRMPVEPEHPIAQGWVSTIWATTMLGPEDKPLTRNMG